MKDVKEILSKMSLEEKIAICEGKNFWETMPFEQYGVPSIFMCDGPHGLRKQEMENATDMLGINNSRPATCFPTAVTTASSWNKELLQEIGKAIADEAKDQGVSMVLGPGVNIKRNPLCGRNFEYFSEDPCLAGKLAAAYITGMEGEGIATSLKHFAANSQEHCRFVSDGIMDERTLREIYLPAFETAVKEGRPSTVMCSYPKLNGVHLSDNKRLLTDILRDEWGFSGMVVTDWGAMCDRIEGFKAGCDLNMPGGSKYMEKEAAQAVREGTLSEEDVDKCAERVLRLVFHALEGEKGEGSCDYEAHHVLAKKAAMDGAVLLKNEGDLFPLREDAQIAVFGHMAKELRYQGAGSSHINVTKLSQPIDFLPKAIYEEGVDVHGDTTDDMIERAVKAAKEAEICIVFAGLPDRYESEGFDRSDMKMPEGHLRLIEAVAKANENTAVVLLAGAPVECPWAESVKAILYMGLPGQAGGEAVADLLYGRTNPSGKLAESWPFKYEDCVSSAYYGKDRDALYLEGIYVGYRYYDRSLKAVRWPFGYGLSYTDFEYSNLDVTGNTVTVSVTNKGKTAGSEVVQLYIWAPQDGLHRPLKELKSFEKVFLGAGETRSLNFDLADRDFAIWQDGWKVPGGIYRISVGALFADVEKEGEPVDIPSWQKGSFYEDPSKKPCLEEFEKMIGRKYSAPVLKKGSFTLENTVAELKDYSLIMKIMYKAVESVIAKAFGGKKDYDDPAFRMMMESSAGSPLRSLMVSGGMQGGVIPGMLEIANGRFFKGIAKMIKG